MPYCCTGHKVRTLTSNSIRISRSVKKLGHTVHHNVTVSLHAEILLRSGKLWRRPDRQNLWGGTKLIFTIISVGRVAYTVQRLSTDWTVRGSNPGGGARFSAPVQTDPEAHPASCTMGTRSFQGVRCGRGVTLIPHPF
jgi:hypothetical protein